MPDAVESIFRILFTFCITLSPCVSNKTVYPTPDIQQSVMKSLVANAVQTTSTPQAGWGENAPGVQHVLEITPEPAGQELPTTASSSGAISDEYYIRNIWGHRQFFRIRLRSFCITGLGSFLGWDINEFQFQFELPVSDNPDLGFVGSVYDPWGQAPPYSYGVHAAPVAEVLLSKYGIPAKDAKGLNLTDIKRKIASGQPVIAWVIGNCVGGIPHEYTDKQGNIVIVVAYEHVVIVTGYNITHICYMYNGRFYDIPNEYFLNS